MRFTHYPRPTFAPHIECWKSQRGFWSFLIARDRAPGAICHCSYRDMRAPRGETKATCATIFFRGDEEIARDDAPDDFGYANIDDAMRACEQKYKQLLTR